MSDPITLPAWSDQPPPFVTQFAQSMLRGWLDKAAGALAALGVISDDQTAQLVSIGGAVGLWALREVWSYFHHRAAERRLKAAIAAPVGKAAP